MNHCVGISEDDAALPLVVVLTKGLLRDLAIAQVLLAACAAGAMLHPALIERSFDFPGHEFLSQVYRAGLERPGMGAAVGPRLSQAYQALLKVLALPLSPHASIGARSRRKATVRNGCRHMHNSLAHCRDTCGRL